MSTAGSEPPVIAVGRESWDSGTSPPKPSHVRDQSVRSATPIGQDVRTRPVHPVSARVAAGRRDTAMKSTDPGVRAADAAVEEDRQQSLKKEQKLERRTSKLNELIETLRNKKREAGRKIREMETTYEAERSAILREKEEMATKEEEEMQMVIARLKKTLAQKLSLEDNPRPSRQSSALPSLDGSGFAPPSSLQRSDSRNRSRLILQKDTLIESLRLELAEAQIKLVETENQGGGKLQEVERQLMEARMSNARLMEDNESYQRLLQEKSPDGDLGHENFGQSGWSQSDLGQSDLGSTSPTRNHEAINAPEGKAGGFSLADELWKCSGATQSGGEYIADHYHLESELKALQETNKVLTKYINKIIDRPLHQDTGAILDQPADVKPPLHEEDEGLPPPPLIEKPQINKQVDEQSIPRQTRTAPLMPGRAMPRPFSATQTSDGIPLDLTDLEKAPNIPIGLGRTHRRSRPVSDQFPGPESLVSRMYKGPDSAASPPLSQRHSHAFSPIAGVIGTLGQSHNGIRAPSSGSFPGATGGRSGASSLSGEGGGISTPSSQSPARSHSDKQRTFSGGKLRPLRLVQENPDAVRDNNGGKPSWISGWGWGGKKNDNLPVSPAILE